MAVRTVRLDEESEKILAEIRQATGLSVSMALKRGLVAVRDAQREEQAVHPYEIYESLDLGSGGWARAPARKAKEAIRSVLKARRRKR